jgi:hypothetical protein
MKPLLCIALVLSACSAEPTTPPVDPSTLLLKGQEAAAKSDWATALVFFEAALETPIRPHDPAALDERYRARRGAIQAQAAQEPLKALHRATELIANEGERLDTDLFGSIAGDFRKAGSLDAAAFMTALGLKRFPGNPGLKNLEERINAETWQLMQTDMAAIGYLRQEGSEALAAFGLEESEPSHLQSFLKLLQPVTWKSATEQGSREH